MQFISRRNLYRKYLIISTIFLLLGSGLYIFYLNQEFLDSFKIYYLKSYRLALNYDLLNAKNALASILFPAVDNPAVNDSGTNTATGNAKSVPVLLYHGIIDVPDGANILIKNFKDQMFTLKKNGWQTVSIEDFYKFIKGEKNLPDKSFLLTFDDGAKDSYYPVDPILKVLDYNAATFIITKYSVGQGSGSSYYLSKNELRRAIKSGRWDIQAHTREGHDFYIIDESGDEGHFFSSKLWLDDKKRLETEEEFKSRIYNDFVNSKNDLENEFGIKVISFAFPFGDFGQNSLDFPEAEPVILDAAKEVYSMAFYQVWPGKGYSFNYSNKDFLIKRIDVKPDWSAEALLTLLDSGKEKPFPYSENFEKYSGWIKTWGGLILGNNSMILGATDLNNGGAVFLDGSRLWKNYSFLAQIDWIKGKNVSLLARYKDDKNYAACSFSDNSIKVEQVLNGKKKILSELRGDFVFIGKNREVGIGIYDDAVHCYLDGKIVASGFNLNQELNSGGIGFKTWDSKVNNSEIIIKKVNVRKINGDEASEFILAIKRELAKDKLSALKKSLESARQVLADISDKQKEGNRADSDKKSFLASANILWSLVDNSGNSTPYHRIDFTGDLGWKKLWGEYFVKDKALHISSGNSNSSALVIQNNSVSWSDYFFQTRLDWLKGATFSLVARYQDSKNYMSCVYSNYGDGVRLDQVIDGKTTTLASNYGLSVPYFMPWADLNFGVKVRDNYIECFIGDQRIFKFNVDQMPKMGGIGFKVWDSTSIGGEVAIKEINVEAIKN